ncbi:MAG: hypothetical protein GY895_11020 [Phycisphaera sp.]|nr:hypothetical protein [Phycisphaera sp.]
MSWRLNNARGRVGHDGSPPEPSPPSNRIVASVADTPAELEAVQAFRYRMLKDAGRMTDEPCLDHERGLHRDPLDHRLLVIYARDHEGIVGTFRWGISDWTSGNDPSPDRILSVARTFESVRRSRVGRSDRLVIDPGRSGRHAATSLFSLGLQIAIDARCRFDVCWCVPSLTRFYKRLGYEPLDLTLESADGRPMTALILDLADLDGLTRRRSPLARFIRRRDVA